MSKNAAEEDRQLAPFNYEGSEDNNHNNNNDEGNSEYQIKRDLDCKRL